MSALPVCSARVPDPLAFTATSGCHAYMLTIQPDAQPVQRCLEKHGHDTAKPQSGMHGLQAAVLCALLAMQEPVPAPLPHPARHLPLGRSRVRCHPPCRRWPSLTGTPAYAQLPYGRFLKSLRQSIASGRKATADGLSSLQLEEFVGWYHAEQL